MELGLWVPIHRGVYRLAGTPSTPASQALAAYLATGGAATGRTAALLWGIPAPTPSLPEILLPHGARRTHPGIAVKRTTTIAPGDLVSLRRVPITSPARTLVDLAGVVSPARLEVALDDALARRLVTLRRLAERLERFPLSGCEGVGVLHRLLAAYAPPAAESRSHLSQAFVRLFDRLGLPEPVVEMAVPLPDGGVIHVDLGYPEARVAIEIQSQRWHTGRRKTEADLARENELELADHRLLHLTASDLRRPDYVRRVVLGALGKVVAP